VSFEPVDEILWNLYHSHETSSAGLSHGTIYLKHKVPSFVSRNPMVLHQMKALWQDFCVV